MSITREAQMAGETHCQHGIPGTEPCLGCESKQSGDNEQSVKHSFPWEGRKPHDAWLHDAWFYGIIIGLAWGAMLASIAWAVLT